MHILDLQIRSRLHPAGAALGFPGAGVTRLTRCRILLQYQHLTMWINGCTIFAGGHAHCTPAWTLGATPLNQCWKLYYVRRGSGTIITDTGEQGLLPGHIYIINGYRMLRQVCPRCMVVDWLHFQTTAWWLRMRLERLPPAVCLPCVRRNWRAAGLEEVRKLFDQPAESYLDLCGLRPDARLEIYLRVLGVLLGVLGEVLEHHAETTAGPGMPPQLRNALDFMERHYLDNPPLATLAQQAGWQAEHFLRRFQQALGVTPFAFMERRRLDEAVQLLIDTPLEVKEVAARLCFSSPSYFTRVFTRKFGLSPVDYRRLASAKPAPTRRNLPRRRRPPQPDPCRSGQETPRWAG
ncbi:MAG: AraC family transcriptional regulator [Opitutaceae bacterium]